MNRNERHAAYQRAKAVKAQALERLKWLVTLAVVQAYPAAELTWTDAEDILLTKIEVRLDGYSWTLGVLATDHHPLEVQVQRFTFDLLNAMRMELEGDSHA